MSITTTNYNTAEDKKDEVVSLTYGEGSGVGSKSNIERLAEDYVNSNYESFTKGPDYESLAKRYSDQGRKAMQDTMGQVAARTGGLASSYATTASQQAYGDWMGRLEDAARSLYDSQMAEKASKLGVAQGMYSVIDANNEQPLTDWREGYEPTFEIEETEAKLEAGDWSPNLLKNYEVAYGESYFAKFNDTDWEVIESQPRETRERTYEAVIVAWCAYDEEGCLDYIYSLPKDHPLKEYMDSKYKKLPISGDNNGTVQTTGKNFSVKS